jgi:hypothetical protein
MWGRRGRGAAEYEKEDEKEDEWENEETARLSWDSSSRHLPSLSFIPVLFVLRSFHFHRLSEELKKYWLA